MKGTEEVQVRGDGGSALLWLREVPEIQGEVLGCIGGFQAADRAAAVGLLETVCLHLRQEGCTLAVGPMDGNTWRNHRLVTWSGGRPRFFLEPWTPPEWPGWWEAAGFRVMASYTSSRLALNEEAGGHERVEARLRDAGVTIRPLKVEVFDAELRAIHGVCLAAFSRNFLYTPLAEDEFVTMYGKARDLLTPDCVWIAEADGNVCGFVFGLPDALAAGRGGRPDFIVKTLAVSPERRLAGLGNLLVDKVQVAARKAGFTHAIHALQHETNSSRKITSRHGGELIRRYGLYSRCLRS